MNVKYSLEEIDNLLWVEGINVNSKMLLVRIPVKILSHKKGLLSTQEMGAYIWLESNHPELFL